VDLLCRIVRLKPDLQKIYRDDGFRRFDFSRMRCRSNTYHSRIVHLLMTGYGNFLCRSVRLKPDLQKIYRDAGFRRFDFSRMRCGSNTYRFRIVHRLIIEYGNFLCRSVRLKPDLQKPIIMLVFVDSTLVECGVGQTHITPE